MKGLNLALKKLQLNLRVRPFNRLIKDDCSITTIATSGRTKEYGLRIVDKSIDQSNESRLKNVNQIYHVIISLTKCMIGVGIEKEKENEESKLQE